MADIRKYNPTNQYFKDNFQRFAGTKTKKETLTIQTDRLRMIWAC